MYTKLKKSVDIAVLDEKLFLRIFNDLSEEALVKSCENALHSVEICKTHNYNLRHHNEHLVVSEFNELLKKNKHDLLLTTDVYMAHLFILENQYGIQP